MHLKVNGKAFLCFQANGEVFQGVIKDTVSNDSYCMIGKKSDLPDKKFNECCFEHEPVFYKVEIAKSGETESVLESTTIENVMRLEGDNCRLVLDGQLDFLTEKLLVDQFAEKFIEKYFPSRFLNKGCYICVGDVDIDYFIDKF